jgi:hypothetical protein
MGQMKTIRIGQYAYDVYADVYDADGYLAAAQHAGTTWSSASTLTKSQALVTVTRILDRQRWAAAYDTQAERESVPAIINASIEMALALLQGTDLQSESRSGMPKFQSVAAQGDSVSYYNGSGVPLRRFPTIVNELLRDYLAGSDLAIGMTATGTDGVSSTEDDFEYARGL